MTKSFDDTARMVPPFSYEASSSSFNNMVSFGLLAAWISTTLTAYGSKRRMVGPPWAAAAGLPRDSSDVDARTCAAMLERKKNSWQEQASKMTRKLDLGTSA
jgi:hypothetical protein